MAEEEKGDREPGGTNKMSEWEDIIAVTGVPSWFIEEVKRSGVPPPMPYKNIEYVRKQGLRPPGPYDKSDNRFYHTTPVKNVSLILSKGLIAGYEPTSFGVFIKRPAVPGVYLTDNEDDIYTFYDSLDAYNMFRKHYAILSVVLPWDWPIMLDPEIAMKGIYVTFRSIPAKMVSVLKPNATKSVYEIQHGPPGWES